MKGAGRAAAEKAAALFHDYNLSQTRNSGGFCSGKIKIHHSVKAKGKLCHVQKGVFSWISVWIPRLTVIKTTTQRAFFNGKAGEKADGKALTGQYFSRKSRSLCYLFEPKRAVSGGAFGGISGKTL
ncbi:MULTISPECIES: hypothetical protein [unclassified Neglectibacter]|uniref:hypothetical protein n=1 Tax=unclassified Neglectibacter TaxID=2632164 RepID=UPI00137A09ED|nr:MULTISPECIES: hypothetical protein [unclassified Neglectibacter]